MAEQHNSFFRESADGKIIVVAIVDKATFRFNGEHDRFMLATTSSDIRGRITMTFEPTSEVTADEMTQTMSENVGHYINRTQGLSIDGILKLPIWFSRKFKSITEILYSL